MTPPDDDALFAAWRAGDAAAGDQLVRRHYRRVLRFFEYRVGAIAEDLVQRTFAACADALPTYRAQGTFNAFIFGIARLQLLRHLRDGRRESGKCEFDDSNALGRKTSLSTLVSRHEEQRLLLQSLVALPAPLQTVLVLHYWEGMRAREIAEVCDSTTSTITTRLARARQVLSESIAMLARSGRARESLLANPEQWLASVSAVVPGKESPDA